MQGQGDIRTKSQNDRPSLVGKGPDVLKGGGAAKLETQKPAPAIENVRTGVRGDALATIKDVLYGLQIDEGQLRAWQSRDRGLRGGAARQGRKALRSEVISRMASLLPVSRRVEATDGWNPHTPEWVAGIVRSMCDEISRNSKVPVTSNDFHRVVGLTCLGATHTSGGGRKKKKRRRRR